MLCVCVFVCVCMCVLATMSKALNKYSIIEQQPQSQVLFYFYGTGDGTKTLYMLGKCSTTELHLANFPSYFIEIDQKQEPFHLLVNLYFRVEKTVNIPLKMGKVKWVTGEGIGPLE